MSISSDVNGSAFGTRGDSALFGRVSGACDQYAGDFWNFRSGWGATGVPRAKAETQAIRLRVHHKCIAFRWREGEMLSIQRLSSSSQPQVCYVKTSQDFRKFQESPEYWLPGARKRDQIDRSIRRESSAENLAQRESPPQIAFCPVRAHTHTHNCLKCECRLIIKRNMIWGWQFWVCVCVCTFLTTDNQNFKYSQLQFQIPQ